MPHPPHEEDPAEQLAELPVEPEMPRGGIAPEQAEDVAAAATRHPHPAAPR